jgi:hypothetical protein
MRVVLPSIQVAHTVHKPRLPLGWFGGIAKHSLRQVIEMDGTFSIVYSGDAGLGYGVFTVKDGALKGSDLSVGAYSGAAKTVPGSDKVELDLRMTIPAGVPLVQGVAPQDVAITRAFTAVVPHEFGDGAPITVDVPPGKVTIMVKRLPDDWAVAAERGIKIELRS